MDTREVVARFDAERQALAVMNHPGIARVFDGGATDDGRPFFVMELVEGEPITRFCDRNRLPVTERIALVNAVCKAVQHAHQKGVIHRDLKPSNVLVTMQDGKAVPKVIDFGIAKAVTASSTDRTFATQAGQFVGTPAYMSPEQVGLTGLDIDTRSDIYSLGIVLYELLVGARPYDERQLTTGQGMYEALRDREAPAPATRLKTMAPDAQRAVALARQTQVGALQRALSTDLGWIVAKAIEKDRARRYDTVNGLAADLERYVRKEPVIARPPSTAYRVQKFVARHRTSVAAAAVILALILASTVVIAAQARRVAVERDRASREAAKATSINLFLREMLASANPWGEGGKQMTVVDALAAAEGRIESSLGDQPEVALAVKRTIGGAYSGLGEYPRAERLLNAAVEATRPFPERRQELVETLTALGGALRQAGRLDDASRVQEEAIELARGLGHEHRALLANAQRELADTRFEQGKLEDSERLAASALELEMAVHGPVNLDTARAMETLGNAVNLWKDAARADTLFRQVVDIRRQLRGPRHPEVGVALSNLGAVAIQRGDFDGAVAIFTEALDILRAGLGATHPLVALTNENLSNALYRLGRVDEAGARLEEVLAVRRQMLGDESLLVARTLFNIGAVYTRANQLNKAEARVAEARLRLERALGRDHPEIATVVRTQASIQERLGNLPAAERLFRDSVDRTLRQLGEKNASTASGLSSLGRVLQAQRRYAEAETPLLRALTIREQTLGPTAPLTLGSIDALVKLYEESGQPGKATALRAKRTASGAK